MKIYFSVAPGDKPLGLVEGDYVPAVGDLVHLNLKSWTVVQREFATGSPLTTGCAQVLYAAVRVAEVTDRA